MIKKYTLLFFIFLGALNFGFGQVSDLIISEYGEGTPGSAKYVEIYNGTGGTVNLSNYQLWKITNGGSWNEGTYNFTTATLVDGATIVVANNSTNTPGADEYNSGFCSWNGDDAIGLAKSGTLIDIVGTDGADPGTGWAIAGTNNATVDHTLTRKSTVCSPNTNWLLSAGTNTTNSEWILTTYGNGPANSGHTSSCASTSDLTISGDSTNHDSSCLNTSATTLQYTITNNGAVPALDVNVVSDDPQFVVSNLSSTTIAPSGTATYDVTFTPTVVGAQTATLTISSTTITDDATSIITGTGITAPNITTQPTNQNTTIPNTATFSFASSDAAAYQWEVNSGSGWNNVTGGTGATTNTYTTGATNATMDGNLYRCVASNACGSTTSNSATLNLTNPNPNNVTGISACFEDNSVILSWTPPATGTTPTGYVVFAINGATDPAGTKTDANTYTSNSDFSLATPVTPASLGRVVYKGDATSATITGLTENNNYSFTVYSYVGESLTGWSSGGTGGSTVTNGTAQGDISNLIATPLTNQVNLSWNNPTPTSCFDELLIVANQGSVTFTPTGSYAPVNAPYSTTNTVVYATTSTVSSKAITGLTNGLNYCFKVYIKRGSVWSEGIEVCATPTLTYCDGYGNMSYDTGITGVFFNTINNSVTSSNNSYTDYTNLSTDLELGSSYNLSVNVEVDGNGSVYTKAWIDWNQDGSFNTTTEAYDLGDAYNVFNGPTTNSPLNIEVPTNALIGDTRMRIATKWAAYATPCEIGYSGEVEDYTVNITQPSGPEIVIKGGSITIPNGFSAPYGLNNTLFAATNINNDGDTKTFTIHNIGQTSLTLSGSPIVEVIGDNPGDFIVTTQPETPITSLGSSSFDIKFHPLADGIRTAIVRIINNDSDESNFEFMIQGTGVCSSSFTSSMWPSSGPEGTDITITSSFDLTDATASINGISMPIISTSSSELIVSVPNGASSGNINVIFNVGCSSSNAFSVIDSMIVGCDASTISTPPGDLFISEVSDASTGSSSLIELFNGTGSTVNLSEYVIKIYNNGNSSQSSTSALTGSLANNSTHVIAVGSTSCDLTSNGLSITPNQSFSSVSGINFDINSSDAIVLEKVSGSNTGEKDSFGEKYSNNWANNLGIGNNGVNFRRHNNASILPTMSFNLSDWDMVDWTSCNDSDYSHFGYFDFSLGIPPSITSGPTINQSCNTATISVAADEGYSGGNSLAYQWYYLAPGDSGWTEIMDDATFNNSDSAILEILDIFPVVDYQFYCQIREDDQTCFTASNAVILELESVTWDGSTWTPSNPTSNTIAILNADYNTTSSESFEACNLIINNSALIIGDIDNGGSNTYVEVQYSVYVNGNGSILVHPQAAFVQVNDDGVFEADNPDNCEVDKLTAPMAHWYEYTYWSSPTVETIGDALAEANPNRRFKFSGQDFRDSYEENSNTNTFNPNPGIDDIDDDPNYISDGTGVDWQLMNASDDMLPGVGYASTHSTIGFNSFPCSGGPGCQFLYQFKGLFNNGVISVPVYRNDEEPDDNNWNFIGNPYPSAISADAFLEYNTDISSAPNRVIEGAIYLWSQNTDANGNASGNQALNFSQSDYAIINGIGSTATSAGGDGSNPDNRMIPSGQGFFITMSDGALGTTFTSDPSSDAGDIQSKDVIFNNSMRVKGNSDNSQFFRNATQETNSMESITLSLTSDNGIFSQVVVGYKDGATNGLDYMYYDAPANSVSNNMTLAYFQIEDSNKKFAIQGKHPESLTLEEVIPLGFQTNIEEASIFNFEIAQLKGDFMLSHSIYIKDNFFNTYHDLTQSAYTFNSEAGEFNDRFEIVFQTNALSTSESVLNTNDLTIIELDNGMVSFTVRKNQTIENVQIYDLLGRSLLTFTGNSSKEVLDLSSLSSSAYLAKVTLDSGQEITKKAIKR
ncbi:choice-of-anchor D domain-containing protein [Mangrovimonas sp. CR14]|uniref:lamin tail domain-containing protein n=1 Tax=Mangrovimonas sp. CR14 TaxID=2706120 RepID=UPI001422CD2B|nr:lamin tail domain-containing protein [Mangrovimonas sp. CR14]NIK91061.1 choice-of-anchor D domain-containing protein [Mangrovimonas sp. CR14]